MSVGIYALPRDRVKKSSDEKSTLDEKVCAQIDELQRIAEEERDRKLGAQWFTEIDNFYNLMEMAGVSSLSFRPRVVIPELQTLMLAEATDISESTPKVFILNKDKREKEREKAYKAHWRQQQYNLEIFFAELGALFCGTWFLEVGLDPDARRGKGEVWVGARSAENTFPDPGPLKSEQWIYVIKEDKMYLDEICRCWPEAGARLRQKARGTARIKIGDDTSGMGGLQLPEGPMRYGSGAVPQQRVLGDGRLVVRSTYIKDYTTIALDKLEKERAHEVLGNLVPVPSQKLMFPNGRWIVDCERVVLADGNNWCPLRRSPIIPVQTMPRLKSFWVPPPTRYSKSLQQLAERMYTGVFENGVRLNNGTWFIHENTGLEASDFGGLPGEIRIINSGSQVPEVRYGQAMPAHFTQLPELLLAKQRQIHGFTPMRSGQPAAGNVAQDLFDASVFQSQVLTRMRAKLLAPSMQELAETVFYTMMRYYRQGQVFPGFGQDGGEDGLKLNQWTPADQQWEETYDVYLDPGSIKPLSASYLRALVTKLMDTGKLPLKYALETLDFPDADEISEEQREQAELAAMAKLKRPR